MIIFLDFDGVLHPISRANRERVLFSQEEHLARVLRDFPPVEIVISSAWRQDYSLKAIQAIFRTDLRNRIVGMTPIFEIRDAGDVAGSRYREIQAYLAGSIANWLALDDDASLFPAGCAELVLCEDGFQDAEERALRDLLLHMPDEPPSSTQGSPKVGILPTRSVD